MVEYGVRRIRQLLAVLKTTKELAGFISLPNKSQSKERPEKRPVFFICSNDTQHWLSHLLQLGSLEALGASLATCPCAAQRDFKHAHGLTIVVSLLGSRPATKSHSNDSSNREDGHGHSSQLAAHSSHRMRCTITLPVCPGVLLQNGR